MRLWVIVALPLVLGLVLATLFLGGVIDDPILFARVDAGLLSFILGFSISSSAAVAGWLWQAGERGKRNAGLAAQSRAADERRRFLQRLDHELKNPLTAIRAAVVNLSDAPGDVAQRSALASVEGQTRRLSHLLSDLRKLAELETRPIERSSIDLDGLLREVVAVADESAARDHRRLTLTLPQAPWPLPAIAGDRDLLFLAVHNLVDNALKFSRSGDTVEVRAFEDGASVVLEVADTGPGIGDTDAPHVWEELYRGKSARQIPGSGLGLTLVRAIAERHGGRVSLRSREGQGTVVTLRLPVGTLPR